MQCHACHFENMPGMAVCGSCTAPLGIRTTSLKVHPPRAGAAAKWLRRSLRYRELRPRLEDGAALFFASWFRRVGHREASSYLRTVMPGWAQIYRGEGVHGWVMLGASLLSAFCGLLFLGSRTSTLLLCAAIALHTSSISAAVRAHQRDWRAAAALCIFVLAVVYAPVIFVGSRFLGTARVVVPNAELDAGDVLLYLRAAEVVAGDVVVYDMPRVEVPIGKFTFTVTPGGMVFDRVLGLPGETLRWEGKKFFVDGVRSRLLPLDPRALPSSWLLTVPPDHYCIVPSTVRRIHPPILQQISLVRREWIRGPVRFRQTALGVWERFASAAHGH